MASNGELYVADPDHVARLVYTMRDGVPDLVTREKGTAVYKEGRIKTWDQDAVEHLMGGDPAAWIVWGGTYMRIWGVRVDGGRHGKSAEIECSQAKPTGYAEINGDPAYLLIVEPSPPRPLEEWLPHERARAVRDLVAEERGPDARPRVRVPAATARYIPGSLVEIDPWGPEFTEVPDGE